LDGEFIKRLNKLYQDKNGWWHRLADDRDVFVAIRDNSLNAYVHGGSAGKITWDGASIGLTVHPAYLVFPDRTGKSPYQNLLSSESVLQAVVINNTQDYVTHFKRIKNIVRTLQGSERRGENQIAARLGAVIDIEAAFATEADAANMEFEDASLGPGRIDLLAVADDTRLVCTEAKLFDNGELRSATTPAVCGQLVAYFQWLDRNAEAIKEAYGNVAGYYKRLEGRFFQQRSCATKGRYSIDPIPRLLIFGFDSHQRKSLEEVKHQVCKGVRDQIPGFTPKHIRCVGKPGNVQAPKVL
jgi:hypothetical protein